MGRKIIVKGFEEGDKLSFEEEKRELVKVRKRLFNKVVDGERDRTLMALVSKFQTLRYEDLEEVYNDGCLVLWNKFMDEEFELIEKSIVWYLWKICDNIGKHYLRMVNDNIESLDVILERDSERVYDDADGLVRVFDVFDEEIDDEAKLSRLDEIWEQLSNIDKMILESYYVEKCKLEEIAKRVGYKNANTVKSKKDKVLKRMLKMMKEKENE